jgi:hypothetical protein
MSGKSSSMTETWKDAYMLNFVFSLVQTNFFQLNCSFKDFSTSSAETSGLKRETKRALDLAFCVL